jgi:hypothetical protein
VSLRLGPRIEPAGSGSIIRPIRNRISSGNHSTDDDLVDKSINDAGDIVWDGSSDQLGDDDRIKPAADQEAGGGSSCSGRRHASRALWFSLQPAEYSVPHLQ